MEKIRKPRSSIYDKLIRQYWKEVYDENPRPRAKDYGTVILNLHEQGIIPHKGIPNDIHTQIVRSLKRLTEEPNPFIVQEGRVFFPAIIKKRIDIGAIIIEKYLFAQPDILTVCENIIAISFTKNVTDELKQLFKDFCDSACYDVVSIDTVVLIFLKEPGTDIALLGELALLKRQLKALVFDGYYQQNPSLQKPDSKPTLQAQPLPKASDTPSSVISQLPYKPFSK